MSNPTQSRTEAVRTAGGPNYGATMAAVYVGDQLGRVADALEAKPRRRAGKATPSVKHDEAQKVLDDDRWKVIDVRRIAPGTLHIVLQSGEQ